MNRVALLSKWHVHAKDYAREAQENPSIEIAKVWDEDDARGRSWASDLGVPFEQSLDAVLQDESINAVIVTTPTNLHKDVLISAAKHGKHIFTEKVLAFNIADCDEIFQTVEVNQVKLMVSLPRLTHDYYLYVQKAVDEGLLGIVQTVRCRLAHNGAVSTASDPNGWLDSEFYNMSKCGGGALIDLGAHPIYLTNRLAGQPISVSAKLSGVLDLGVDDNSAVIVQYASGALGIIEAGFSSGGRPFFLEVHGTKGSVVVDGTDIRFRTEESREWTKPTDIPKALPMPMEQWVSWMEDGVEPSIHQHDVRNLTLINEAAALSNRNGQSIQLTNETIA